MGAGKSSIGLKLAELIQRPFYDSDHEIEKRCGVSISWIFEKEQEIGFRHREVLIIQELCQLSGVVLSTGGGTILNPQTQSLLKNTGIIIYLEVSLPEQVARTLFRKNARPLLQENPAEKLAKLNQDRKIIYEGLADITVLTDQQNPLTIAQKIEKQLQCLAQH